MADPTHVRLAFTRAEHLFEVSQQLQRLAANSVRNGRHQRLCKDKLDSLEARISRMHQIVRPSASEPLHPESPMQIAQKDKSTGQLKARSQAQSCSQCAVQAVWSLVCTHQAGCTGPRSGTHQFLSKCDATTTARESRVDPQSNNNVVDSLAAEPQVVSPPHAPRDFEYASSGCNFIEFKWQPPVFTGGAPILDYEISFKQPASLSGGSPIQLPPVLTSRWFHVNPVAHRGFVLGNLRADTVFVCLTVRCRNFVGWGPCSNQIASASTTRPQCPSSPLFFAATKVTATAILFKWRAPFDDGGSKIVALELSYDVKQPKADFSQGNVAQTAESIRRTVKVRGTAREYLLTNLTTNCGHENIRLTAVNEAELRGTPAIIECVQTLVGHRRQDIACEMYRVRNINQPWIDTDFYSGYPQRLLKATYLDQLQRSWREAKASDPPPDADEYWEMSVMRCERWFRLTHAALKAASQSAESALDELSNEVESAHGSVSIMSSLSLGLQGDFGIRDAQFVHKIKRVKLAIESFEAQRVDSLSRRTDLKMQLLRTQQRSITVKSELVRVTAFRGSYFTSSVMHGSDQRFESGILKQELEKELTAVAAAQAEIKIKLINDDNARRVAIEGKVAAESDLKSVATRRMQLRAEARLSLSAHAQAHHQRGETHFLLEKTWLSWCTFVETKQLTKRLLSFFCVAIERMLCTVAWDNWAHGAVKGSSDADTRLQAHAKARIAATLDISGVLCATRETRRCIESMGNLTQLSSLANVCEISAATHGEEVEYLGRGECYMRSGEYLEAISSFRSRIFELKATLDGENETSGQRANIIYQLSVAHRSLASAYYAVRKWDLGLCSSDYAVKLGEELCHPLAVAEGTLCRGEGFLGIDEYRDAQVQFELALFEFEKAHDRRREAHVHRRLEVAYRGTVDTRARSENHRHKAEHIERELASSIKRASLLLSGLKERLLGTSAEDCKVVKFERVTPDCVRMRHDRSHHRRGIKLKERSIPAQSIEVDRLKELDERIASEISDCAQAVTLTRSSSLVTGALAEYDIAELRVRLAERKRIVGGELEEEAGKLRDMKVGIVNHHEGIRVLDELLLVEKGELMMRALGRISFRTVAFNSANTASNNVLGHRTGGGEFIPLIAASEGVNIHVFDAITGTLKVRFAGDQHGRHWGELEGHTKSIQCLAFAGDLIYSGGLDAVVHVWNVRLKRRTLSLTGHESSVNCVAAAEQRIFSGSADTTIRVWDHESGAILRVLRGHKKTVMCMDVGPTWLVSGGAEGAIRVWKVSNKEVLTATTKRRPHVSKALQINPPDIVTTRNLCGHGSSVTSVRYGVMEVVSGANDGSVTVWWLNTGEAIRRCAAHSGPVTQVQFDATRIVSSGVDGNVVVCDITTGAVLQTMRCESGRALAVVFDQIGMVGAMESGEVRSWKWAGRQQVRSSVMSQCETPFADR